MSIQQAAAAAVAVFPHTMIATTAGTLALPVVMTAISGAETGGTWDPSAGGDCGMGGPACGPCLFGGTGATSWGLWQIHNVHAPYLTQVTGSTNPCTWASWLADPIQCAHAALAVLRGTNGLNNWTTYQDGSYRSYLPAATSAVAAAGAPVGSAPGPTNLCPPGYVWRNGACVPTLATRIPAPVGIGLGVAGVLLVVTSLVLVEEAEGRSLWAERTRWIREARQKWGRRVG